MDCCRRTVQYKTWHSANRCALTSPLNLGHECEPHLTWHGISDTRRPVLTGILVLLAHYFIDCHSLLLLLFTDFISSVSAHAKYRGNCLKVNVKLLPPCFLPFWPQSSPIYIPRRGVVLKMKRSGRSRRKSRRMILMAIYV